MKSVSDVRLLAKGKENRVFLRRGKTSDSLLSVVKEILLAFQKYNKHGDNLTLKEEGDLAFFPWVIV